jgi:hypothetical protein
MEAHMAAIFGVQINQVMLLLGIGLFVFCDDQSDSARPSAGRPRATVERRMADRAAACATHSRVDRQRANAIRIGVAGS